MHRCATCPIDDPSMTCHAIRSGVARLCELAAVKASYRQLVISRTSQRPPEGWMPGSVEPRDRGRDGRVRVGLWAPGIGQGGGETWMLSLARHAPRDAVAWSGLVVDTAAGITSPAMAARLGAFMPIGSGEGAARTLAESSDVILSWSVRDLDDILRDFRPRPAVIQVLHQPALSGWTAEAERMLGGVDRFVGVSGVSLRGIPGSALDKSSIIGNAVEPDRLAATRPREAMHREWGVPDGCKVAGYLGRIAREKDPMAMHRLAGSLPDGWHAVVVGSGQLPLPPHPKLSVVGPVVEPGDSLAAMDVVVVPSLYETFGLTIAECLWLGTPVVTTPVGIAETRGLTRLVPIGSSGDALAAAVLAADRSGPMPGSRDWARDTLGPARFGREWADLIASLSPAEPPRRLRPVAENIGLRARMKACPHRTAPACGCPAAAHCSLGKGLAGTVNDRDCFSCLESANRPVPMGE